MNKNLARLSILILASTLSACTPTIKDNFIKDAQERMKWNKEQQHVAFRCGCRWKFLEDKDGNYQVKYAVLPNEAVTQTIYELTLDLDSILDYKNENGWVRHLEMYPDLRKHFEEQEKIAKALLVRLRNVDNYNNFQDYMGQRSSYRPGELDRAYDSAKVFLLDMAKEFTYSSDQIEEARKAGTLKEIERFILFDQITLGHKMPDPSDPEDPNKFVWYPVKRGVEMVGYKILTNNNPKERNVEYVEGTRVTIESNGSIKRESKPAVKLFVPTSGYSAVLLVDQDQEGEIGYMLPDFVEKVQRVASAKELLSDSLFARLFKMPEYHKRVPPKKAPMSIEIARVGGIIDLWETNPSGWNTQFTYKNQQKDNYSVSLTIKDQFKSDHDPSSRTKQIAYIKKQWQSNGSVVEYFYPKPPYDKANIVEASAYNKRIELTTNDGDTPSGQITPDSNKWIKDKAFAVAFNESDSGPRWLLQDDDGDGVYEKRRQITLGQIEIEK